MISELGAISTDEAVVSFSPIIYVGAVFFPLLTAILAASKPARKAASISPIEAQKYTGVTGTVKHIRSLAHGKPYRMAWRNIFRDKKRAGVVLFSLFLGRIFQSILILLLKVILYWTMRLGLRRSWMLR